jgi:hypothetical protein
MKYITEEGLHAIDEARLKHPALFEGVAVESEAFPEALAKWAREFPAEASAYERSINTEGALPMEILDYWDEVELFAKKFPPGTDIVEIIRKWMAANPGKVKEQKSGFEGTEIPTGVRD